MPDCNAGLYSMENHGMPTVPCGKIGQVCPVPTAWLAIGINGDCPSDHKYATIHTRLRTNTTRYFSCYCYGEIKIFFNLLIMKTIKVLLLVCLGVVLEASSVIEGGDVV